jgi:heat shock protein HslJ
MNKITMSLITILIVSGLILSACAASVAPSTLAGTSWTLVSYGGAGNQTPAAAGILTSVVFAPNGQVSGNLGCNGFSGTYMVKDGTLVFGPLASTLMACPDPQMTQEGTAFQVLSGTVRFTAVGSTLTIFSTNGTTALTLSRIVGR